MIKHRRHGGHALDDVGHGLGLDGIDGPENTAEHCNEINIFTTILLFYVRGL